VFSKISNSVSQNFLELIIYTNITTTEKNIYF